MGGQAGCAVSTDKGRMGGFRTVSEAVSDQKEAEGEILRVRIDGGGALAKKGPPRRVALPFSNLMLPKRLFFISRSADRNIFTFGALSFHDD